MPETPDGRLKELEIKQAELHLEKADLEVEELRKPLFRKSSFWIALVTPIIGIGGIVLGVVTAITASQRAELAIQLEKSKFEQSRLASDRDDASKQLNAARSELAQVKREIIEVNKAKLAASVAANSFKAQAAKIESETSNEKQFGELKRYIDVIATEPDSFSMWQSRYIEEMVRLASAPEWKDVRLKYLEHRENELRELPQTRGMLAWVLFRSTSDRRWLREIEMIANTEPSQLPTRSVAGLLKTDNFDFKTRAEFVCHRYERLLSRLGAGSLESAKAHPEAVRFREFVRDFDPDTARDCPELQDQ